MTTLATPIPNQRRKLERLERKCLERIAELRSRGDHNVINVARMFDMPVTADEEAELYVRLANMGFNVIDRFEGLYFEVRWPAAAPDPDADDSVL